MNRKSIGLLVLIDVLLDFAVTLIGAVLLMAAVFPAPDSSLEFRRFALVVAVIMLVVVLKPTSRWSK